ncbi:MAG: hypothetical protein IPN42_03115 [Methylococcaceae bacterium]|nr:hypothetical protein [Methylococcaceae bacterium]
MKILISIVPCLLMFGMSFPAFSVTNEEIAKAYVQAVTGGTGSKVAGTINYVTLGCTPATVFDDNKCQKIVFNGKDGKAILMETITAANVAQLVPLDAVKRAYQYYDPTYDNVRELFNLLSTRGSSWFTELDGNGKTKHILQKHFESTGAGGMYGNFVWPFDTAGPETAKMTAAGVDFYINTLPTADTPDVNHSPFYYWALQTDFSDMEYPAGFTFPPDFKFPDPSNPGLCQDTTTAWGHVGLQYLNNHSLSSLADVRQANWGGGGDGSGVTDYGCGGSDVTKINWQVGTWYEYKVLRGAKLGPKLWNWVGTITKKGTATPIYTYSIYGGEYITFATTWLEPIGVNCTDPKLITQWAKPWLGNATGKFRVGKISLEYSGGDACQRSVEVASDSCNAKWTQHQGALAPVGHAAANLLRKTHLTTLIETDCARIPDATEVAIAKAYVQAITDGSRSKKVANAIDFVSLGCTSVTVWEEANCLKSVFNGKGGRTILLEAITTAADGNWEHTNIKTLIPPDALLRIMTDIRYAQAKELFGYFSTQNNGWYGYLDGPGKAKDTLLQYMNSLVP